MLHFSEHAAYLRIEAARTARRLPVVLELLADGSLTLTTIGLLRAHLTEENHRQLLDEARHKSKRDVEKMIAALRPLPAVASAVRKIPTAPARDSLPPAALVMPAPRCEDSTGFLEFHHVVPFAEGGATDAVNLQLRCRAHNAFEADAWFGTFGAGGPGQQRPPGPDLVPQPSDLPATVFPRRQSQGESCQMRKARAPCAAWRACREE